MGVCKLPIMERRVQLEPPAQVNRETVPVDTIGYSLHKSTLQRPGNIQVYTIHKNKHGEVFKMKIKNRVLIQRTELRDIHQRGGGRG